MALSVSVVCFLLVVYLFLSEFATYMSIETTSELLLDASDSSDADHNQRIKVSLNVTVHSVPCMSEF